MEKYRIQVTVKNPGLEGTENALGALIIDFEDKAVYEMAMRTIKMQQLPHAPFTIWINNEKGEEISWDSQYFHSLWTGRFDEWARPSWLLPSEGEPPRPGS